MNHSTSAGKFWIGSYWLSLAAEAEPKTAVRMVGKRNSFIVVYELYERNGHEAGPINACNQASMTYRKILLDLYLQMSF